MGTPPSIPGSNACLQADLAFRALLHSTKTAPNKGVANACFVLTVGDLSPKNMHRLWAKGMSEWGSRNASTCVVSC